MRIAVIGAGNIGSTLVRRLAGAGHDVRVTNSRSPETLSELAAETEATALPLDLAVQDADVAIVSIPVKAVKNLAVRLAATTVVVDTGNYVPNMRDGKIAELDAGMIESRWTEAQLGHPVIKAFNSINAASLRERSASAGAPDRIALPVAGDDPEARTIVMRLVEDTGFDAVDAGGLDDSWRQQPGTPAYTTNLPRAELIAALAAAEPGQTVAWRDRMRGPMPASG